MLWRPHQGISGHKAKIIDAIKLAYSSLGQLCPMGVKAHSTRSIASSWAWSSGVSIAEICLAAGWASPSRFGRFSGSPYLTGTGPFSLTGSLCHMTTSMGVYLLLYTLGPLIELRGCRDLFGTITQGWVNLDEFEPLNFCRVSLYNTWSLWAPLGVYGKFKCWSFP